MKEELVDRQQKGKRFSVTFDEATTSKSNRRYLNVVLHSKQEYFNLSQYRAIGSPTAVRLQEMLTAKYSQKFRSGIKRLLQYPWMVIF